MRADGARDLARDERLAAARRLVIEEDAVDGEEAVGLAIVDRHPVRVDLRHAVRAARIERRASRSAASRATLPNISDDEAW